MAKRMPVCAVGGDVDVITVGCAGDVCVGVALERYNQLISTW
jgi:hypothetical protein